MSRFTASEWFSLVFVAFCFAGALFCYGVAGSKPVSDKPIATRGQSIGRDAYGSEVVRLDDPARGIVCYSAYKALSCVRLEQ